MSPIIKLYLKVFMLSGVVWGLTTMLFDFISGEIFRSWWLLVLSSLFFGLLMSSPLVSKKKKKLKELGINEFTDENLKVKQKRKFISNLTKEELIDQLKKDEFFGKMLLLQLEDGIELNTEPILWRGSGEVIRINYKPASEGLYEYNVVSRPLQKFAFIDEGNNFENIYRIQKIIQNEV